MDYSPRGRPMSAMQMRPGLSPRAGYPMPMPPGSPRSSMSPRPMSAMMSPRAGFRVGAAPSARPSSAAVRGGGRLYVESPIKGMTENEMINEARIRHHHNKQRQKLKNLLGASADGSTVVNTRDLLLACRIAKLDVGTQNENEVDRFVHPNHIAVRDAYGSPRAVAWKGFTRSIPYPEIYPAGAYPGELPLTRKQKAQIKEYEQQMIAAAQAEGEEGEESEGAKAVLAIARDDEVSYYHKQLKRSLETRFAELRRAFRLIDEDNSGECDRNEFKTMINALLTFEIPEHVLDRMLDLADYDGDGSINFAEFARLATEDDIMNMKKTLQADITGWGAKDAATATIELNKAKAAAQRRAAAEGGYDGGYHPKLRKTGPGLDELRRAHKTIKKAVLARYPDFNTAFKTIDKDGSGTLRRAEIRRFLNQMTKTLSDRVISGLIDFCDDDGDGKTLSKQEFIKLLSAEYLGAGGFDPNAKNIVKKGSRP